MQANRFIPLDWDPAIIEMLAQVAPDDVEGARVWWEQFAPAIYLALLDALAVGDSTGLRGDAGEWLSDHLEDTPLSPAQGAWKKAGLLFIFLGGRYYTLKGLSVPPAQVFGVLNRTLVSSSTFTQGLCDKLRQGTVTLRYWQMQMKDNIIASNITGGILAAGGTGGMTPGIMRAISDRIEFQLGYLDNFANAIAGGMSVDGNVCRLMRMYINSARGTYHAIDGMVKVGLGFNEYRNILGAGEAHCDGENGCPAVSDMGWRPTGTLTPIGSRKCLSNCLCHWQFRNSLTGEEW